MLLLRGGRFVSGVYVFTVGLELGNILATISSNMHILEIYVYYMKCLCYNYAYTVGRKQARSCEHAEPGACSRVISY